MKTQAANTKAVNFLTVSTCILFTMLFFSCATFSSVSEDSFSYSIIQINLTDPDLEIVTWPQTDRWVKPASVKKIAEKNRCYAAINANPFSRKGLLSPKVKGIGIYVDQGQLYLQPSENYGAIGFFRTGNGFRAQVSSDQSLLLSQHPDYALGGFWIILEGETVCQFKDIKDYRSAAGISQDGKTLYLLAAKNMNYMECAALLRKNGAWTALQFDGGSSSQLVFRGKNLQKKAVSRKPAVVLGFRTKD